MARVAIATHCNTFIFSKTTKDSSGCCASPSLPVLHRLHQAPKTPQRGGEGCKVFGILRVLAQPPPPYPTRQAAKRVVRSACDGPAGCRQRLRSRVAPLPDVASGSFLRRCPPPRKGYRARPPPPQSRRPQCCRPQRPAATPTVAPQCGPRPLAPPSASRHRLAQCTRHADRSKASAWRGPQPFGGLLGGRLALLAPCCRSLPPPAGCRPQCGGFALCWLRFALFGWGYVRACRCRACWLRQRHPCGAAQSCPSRQRPRGAARFAQAFGLRWAGGGFGFAFLVVLSGFCWYFGGACWLYLLGFQCFILYFAWYFGRFPRVLVHAVPFLFPCCWLLWLSLLWCGLRRCRLCPARCW